MLSKIKQLFSQVDMTVGTPWKQIVAFSIPMVIGNIAQQLYSTVDSIVVGRYVGDNALAAVGSSTPILNLLLVLLIGIAMGVGIMVSQFFGSRDRENLSWTVGNSITLTAITSAILMVGGSMLIRPILRTLNTPASIFEWCADYLFILLMGISGTAYYNMFCGILRGLGDSVSALVYLLVATVINIVLDLWFVAGLGMGVSGVALATIIAQMVSALCCLRKLRKLATMFDLKLKYLKPRKETITMIIRLGLPSGVTQAIMSLAMVVVQSLTNSFGEMVIAANVIIMRVDGFAMMPNFSFGTAMTTYAGQNVGAGRMDRVRQGAKQGTLIAAGTSATIILIIVVFGRYLMGIFTDTAALVDLSASMMRILAVGYIAVAVTQSLSGVMRGAGDTMTPMWISMVTTIVIRVPIAYGLAYVTRSAQFPNGRHESLFVSLLISWVMGAVITCIFYKLGRWAKKVEVDQIAAGAAA